MNKLTKKICFELREVGEVVNRIIQDLLGCWVSHTNRFILELVKVKWFDVDINFLQCVHVWFVILITEKIYEEHFFESFEAVKLQSFNIELLDAFQEIKNRQKTLWVKIRFIKTIAWQIENSKTFEAAR